MVKRAARFGLLVLAVLCCSVAAAHADNSYSSHYELDESFLGNGGLLNSSSTNYQLGNSSVGDTAVGESSSSSFQTNAGSTTTGDPALSFSIDTPTANFGSFSPSAAATATSTFEVSNYTSYGYVVQILGNAPSNGAHTLAAMSSTGPSQAGTEQFGINLVANTSPVSVGANPDHGQFGFGSAASNYNTSNNYRYVSGETIATAPKSSGVTLYTISYIINVNSLTPGGQYSGNQVLVCTGTY